MNLRDDLRALLDEMREENCAWGFDPCGSRIGDWADRVEALFARLDESHGWQPIETAPKDGSRILIVYDAASGNRVTEARWHFYYVSSGVREGWQCDIGYVPATHWMTLPDPPERSA